MYFGKKIGIIAVVISLITGMFYFKPMGTAYAAAPTATIVVADTLLAIGETSVVTFTFSEAVSGFSLADLTLSNGILSNLMTSDSITYTATLTPASGTTAASNVITLDNTGVISIGGAAGTGTTTSNNYAVDTVRPTATIAVYDTALTAGETSQVTVTFSEAVTGLTVGDLTVSNGTLTGLSSSDGGIMWTATFTPTANIREANNIITLNNTGISDISGNAGIGTTISNNYAIDTVPSTVPTATIVVADTLLAIGETSVVTFTFSEAVSGFSLADLTLSNGILSNLMTSDSITYTATLTPASGTTAASNVITLDNTGVISIGGAAGTGTTTSNNYAVDTVRPTATIAVYDTALTAGETSQVTVTFSEAVTGLTVGDLTVSNGTLTGLSSSDGGIMWTATFTPTANIREANNIITLNNTGISDISGNAGIGTTISNNYAIDTVPSTVPTATIVVADTLLAIGETSVVTFTFSEAVSGFSLADLTLSNGILSNLMTSDSITYTATLTPASGTTAASNVITLDNTGVISIGGAAGTGTTTSNNYTVDTVRPTATIAVYDTALTAGETSQVTVTFSEAVTGLTVGDLTVSNGTLTGLSSSDGGIMWTATFTPTANIREANNIITLDNTGISDISGNAGIGTTDSNPYSVFTVQSVPATTPSSSPPYGPMVPVDNTVTSTTGKITVPTGKSGMVSLGREIQIWIPAGASSQELTLSIDKVLNIETLLKNNEILVSPVFELHKNFPENFLKPIKITFYFQSAGLESHHKAAISYYDEINKTWLKVDGGLINGDQITVEINHFTKFAVLAVGQTNGEFIRNNPVELPSVQSYSDTIGHWAEEGIKQASREGIITGYPDGTFRPGNNVTRAEFSVMLMSALKSKEVGAELLFTDTTEIGAWAKKATSQAVQSGIISGYQDGTFRPNAYLTRAEMVKMVANALYVSTETHDTTPFADAKIIPEWAKTSVALLKERGLVKGMGANQFKPNAQTTRAEAVFLLVNMLEQNNRINN